MNEATPTPPRRRRKRTLSLRALMVLVLLFGGGVGWEAYRARTQRVAVATIENYGGVVEHKGRFIGGNVWAPTWLISLCGWEYFVDVRSVSSRSSREDVFRAVGKLGELDSFKLEVREFREGVLARMADSVRARELTLLLPVSVTDAGLAELASCKSVEKLTIWFDGHLHPLGVHDAWIARLVELPRLRALSVCGCEIGNAGIASLAKIKGLQEVDLGWTELSKLNGASLNALQRFSSLRRLSLSISELNDATLTVLRQLPVALELRIWVLDENAAQSRLLIDVARLERLESLTMYSLRNTGEFPSEFWSRLEKLLSLRELNLYSWDLSEQECEAISRLWRLEKLRLDDSGLAGDGVKHISVMHGLKELKCSDSHLSAAERARIQQALPSLKIW